MCTFAVDDVGAGKAINTGRHVDSSSSDDEPARLVSGDGDDDADLISFIPSTGRPASQPSTPVRRTNGSEVQLSVGFDTSIQTGLTPAPPQPPSRSNMYLAHSPAQAAADDSLSPKRTSKRLGRQQSSIRMFLRSKGQSQRAVLRREASKRAPGGNASKVFPQDSDGYAAPEEGSYHDVFDQAMSVSSVHSFVSLHATLLADAKAEPARLRFVRQAAVMGLVGLVALSFALLIISTGEVTKGLGSINIMVIEGQRLAAHEVCGVVVPRLMKHEASVIVLTVYCAICVWQAVGYWTQLRQLNASGAATRLNNSELNNELRIAHNALVDSHQSILTQYPLSSQALVR